MNLLIGTISPLGAGILFLIAAIITIAHDDHPRLGALLAFIGSGLVGWGAAGLITRYVDISVAGMRVAILIGLTGLLVMYYQVWRGRRFHHMWTPVACAVTGLFLAVAFSALNSGDLGQYTGKSLVTIDHPGPAHHHHHHGGHR
jgi:uncharacterized membrane protein